MTQGQRLGAEALGTFWLVLGGCGAAVITSGFGAGAIGILGVALAFGLTVLTGAYALGHISGGHFNPAVTIGLATARRFDAKDVVPYIVAQVIGGIIAAGVLFAIVEGNPKFERSGNFLAANGFGSTGSPGGYGLAACFFTELVMTFMFLIVILGVTDRRAPAGFAPLGIGLCLTLIHLISIPVTNTSVNPARSIGPALFVGGDWLQQLWLFLVAPPLGAVLAGLAHRFVVGTTEPEPPAAIA
jgi:aquaporin Z